MVLTKIKFKIRGINMYKKHLINKFIKKVLNKWEFKNIVQEMEILQKLSCREIKKTIKFY